MKLSTLRTTLAQLEVTPVKSLGQNFLHDQNLAEWIVGQLDLGVADHFVEVGPGLGALSEYALHRCGSATLIEKDRRLANFLRERFTGRNVEVVTGDAAEFDVRTFFPKMPVKVVGNLPYYISSQILFRFTAEPSPAALLVFTLQKELAQRLSSQPGTADYGALTLIIQRRWRVKYLRSLPPTVFLPEPKVDSAVVSLVPRDPGELPDCDGELFGALVKEGFSQRRKQLRKLLAHRRLDWPGICRELQVSEDVRGEALRLEQWIRLTQIAAGGEPPACVISPQHAAQDVNGEIFDVVDAQDEVRGRASRNDVHTSRSLHRAVHIFVYNTRGELFLQKRSRWKDVHPSKWDSSAAGHVEAGSNYDETAVRELFEELGVESALEPVAMIPASERTGFEFVRLYRTIHEGPFQLARHEIECGGFFPSAVIDAWIERRPHDFASGFLECYACCRPPPRS